jgi:hypothetical protein
MLMLYTVLAAAVLAAGIVVLMYRLTMTREALFAARRIAENAQARREAARRAARIAEQRCGQALELAGQAQAHNRQALAIAGQIELVSQQLHALIGYIADPLEAPLPGHWPARPAVADGGVRPALTSGVQEEFIP